MALTTQNNLNSKAVLARLMAAEDLEVSIDSKAPTASFNLVERKLTLPLWEVGDEAYNMLVGHEVSHALFTPGGEALHQACESISKKSPSVARDYLNVVEDARIERLIKVEYPGLRRSFAEGYRELVKMDLFQIAKEGAAGIAKRPLIDRINLHYKIGWNMTIPFTAEELPLVQKVAETRTWAEVVELSRALFELAKKQKEEEQEGRKGPEPRKGENEENESEETEFDDSGEEQAEQGGGEPEEQEGEENEQGESGTPTPEGEESEEGEEEGEGSGSEGEEGEEEAEGSSGEESEEGEDEAEGSTEGEGEAEGSKAEEAKASGSTTGEGTTEEEVTPDGAQSLRSMEKGLESLTQASSADTYGTVDLPKALPENFMLPLEWTEKALQNAPANGWRGLEEELFAVWKNSNAADVQALWSEFERRKAADAHRRAMTNDTGIIDPLRLVHYKTSDDIFLTNTTVRDGKNHGIVVFLDMSGSMSDKIFQTTLQLVNLAAFARRANLPFAIYGFGDKFMSAPIPGEWGGKWNIRRNSMLSERPSQIITLLESGMSQTRFNKMVGMLIGWAATQAHHVPTAYFNAFRTKWTYPPSSHRCVFSSVMELGSTPTNAALIAGLVLIPQFKAKHRLQVVNTILLTDGEATDQPFNFSDNGKTMYGVVRDPVTRREYRTWVTTKGQYSKYTHSMTSIQAQHLLASVLRDRVGGHVMAIGLVESNQKAVKMAGYFGTKMTTGIEQSIAKDIKEKGFVKLTSKNEGYDSAFVVKMESDESNESAWKLTSADVNDKKSMRNLSKEFIKSLESKRSNRPLMSQIAEVIASNLS